MRTYRRTQRLLRRCESLFGRVRQVVKWSLVQIILRKEEAEKANRVRGGRRVVEKHKPVRVGLIGKDNGPVRQIGAGLHFIGNAWNRKAT